METIRLPGRDVIVIGPSEIQVLSEQTGGYAMLLVACSEEPDDEQKRLIVSAIGTGCSEFCCVGRYAERLHDYVDSLLEDQGLTDVVTTAHGNEPLDDALYYFLNLAAGKPATVVAVVADNPDVALELRRAVAAM